MLLIIFEKFGKKVKKMDNTKRKQDNFFIIYNDNTFLIKRKKFVYLSMTSWLTLFSCKKSLTCWTNRLTKSELAEVYDHVQETNRRNAKKWITFGFSSYEERLSKVPLMSILWLLRSSLLGIFSFSKVCAM